MDFDGTSLKPSALYDENSIYLKMDTGFAFRPHMNNIYVVTSNNGNFNQDGKESAILKIKSYNPPNLIFQQLPVREIVKNIEFTRMRNGYFIDTLTSVDIREIVEFGGKVIRIYEGFCIEETLKYQPLEKL